MRRIIRKHLSRTHRSLPNLVLAALAAGALLVPVRAVHAATPEGACQNGRYAAAAKYNACAQKVTGKAVAGGDLTVFGEQVSKCRVKYTGTWAKLAAKAAGTGAFCDTTRFTDNGTTVTDNLTGLQWEKKQNLDGTANPGDRHDADNTYTWSASGTAADGTAFTDFLVTLNGGGCFAGQCDWRLPTFYELQTILSEAYPCTTSPCIDPVFGPTVPDFYWSGTTTEPSKAWFVAFDHGGVGTVFTPVSGAVRAVRGGL